MFQGLNPHKRVHLLSFSLLLRAQATMLVTIRVMFQLKSIAQVLPVKEMHHSGPIF